MARGEPGGVAAGLAALPPRGALAPRDRAARRIRPVHQAEFDQHAGPRGIVPAVPALATTQPGQVNKHREHGMRNRLATAILAAVLGLIAIPGPLAAQQAPFQLPAWQAQPRSAATPSTDVATHRAEKARRAAHR